MTKKRNIDSSESSTANVANKKSVKLQPMTFDEVSAIIKSGDSEKLKELIDAGSVRNTTAMRNREAYGHSLLLMACQSGFIECARVLLDHHADINYTYIGYETPTVFALQSACLSGNIDMVRFIISRGFEVSDRVLFRLIRNRMIMCHTEIATTLVGYMQDVNFICGHASPLYEACYGGNSSAVRMLLERGAGFRDPNYDPLNGAACGGHLEVIKLLLNWYTKNGRISPSRIEDALDSASRFGYINIMQCLIEYGTDAKALNSALVEAVKSYHIDKGLAVEVARLLLESGADLNAISGYCSAWFLAYRNDSPEMVRLFLDRGADPNTIGTGGDSPLKAVLCSSLRSPLRQGVLQVLLEGGADPNRPFPIDGNTPLLQMALGEGERPKSEYVQAVAALLGHGANPCLAHARTGETPLMIAALDLNIDLVRLLLEHGADVTQVNREGKSVLDMLGRTRKYGEVVKLCTSYVDSNLPGAKLLLK